MAAAAEPPGVSCMIVRRVDPARTPIHLHSATALAESEAREVAAQATQARSTADRVAILDQLQRAGIQVPPPPPKIPGHAAANWATCRPPLPQAQG